MGYLMVFVGAGIGGSVAGAIAGLVFGLWIVKTMLA